MKSVFMAEAALADGERRAREGLAWSARPAVAMAASVLAAGLLLLSLPTIDLWPLAWVGLVPSMWAVMAAPTHRRAFGYGLVTGFVGFAGALSWLRGAIAVFWALSPAASLAVFAVVCLFQALLFGAFAVCLRVARRHTGLPFALLAPVTLVAVELVTPCVVPFSLAVLQASVLPVIQIAEITGPLGVTFCLGMVNGALFDAWDARSRGRPFPRRALAGAALAMTLVLAFGVVRIRQMDARWEAAPKARIGVVQTNVPFDEKPQVDHAGRISAGEAERMREASTRKLVGATAKLQAEGAALVVWPEAAYPLVVPHPEVPAATRLPSLRTRFRVPLLLGAVSRGEGLFNSALLVEPDGRVTGRYDKTLLFPFGERVPFLATLPLLRNLVPASAGGYTPGRGPATFNLADPRAPGGAWKLGPVMCMEDAVSTLGAGAGRLHPHALVVLVNDGWFGATTAPWEHLALSVFRSIEQRTALVRATQTGASALVDATGRVRARIDPTVPEAHGRTPAATLAFDVAMLEAGHTFYAGPGSLWGRGDLLGFVTLVLLGGALVSAARTARLSDGARTAGLTPAPRSTDFQRGTFDS